MIRYGEIGLKGRNRSDFEKRLLENIKTTFGKEVDIHIRHKRLILPVVDEETLKLYERLRFVAGIQSYSLAYMTDRSKDQILKAIIELVENEKTFSISEGEPEGTGSSHRCGDTRGGCIRIHRKSERYGWVACWKLWKRNGATLWRHR